MKEAKYKEYMIHLLKSLKNTENGYIDRHKNSGGDGFSAGFYLKLSCDYMGVYENYLTVHLICALSVCIMYFIYFKKPKFKVHYIA